MSPALREAAPERPDVWVGATAMAEDVLLESTSAKFMQAYYTLLHLHRVAVTVVVVVPDGVTDLDEDCANTVATIINTNKPTLFAEFGRMYRLEGKVVLITGASAGIGEATAREFAAAGAHVILTARREEKLKALAQELSSKYPSVTVHTVGLDVQDREAVQRALASLPANLQEVDVLVNNAGMVVGVDKLLDVDPKGIDQMFNTNVYGLMYVIQAVVPGMKARNRGHVINIGSVSGKQVYSGGGIYCATKHAVDAITRTLHLELVDTAVRVTEINPGLVNTEFSTVRFSGDKAKADNVYKGMNPLTGQDVAEIIVFAASRPDHVNIADLLVFPVNQADSRTVHRA
ncbi:hypothetical protein BZG36_03423 [Bifiguratus adelaidae]|uniref:Ketoreductase domain-containing protein n=1 Tax=Bifiguratus adelaidae TaxID=1938954 RepID=A0A261XYR8_9FUNG|nr:hypothetical protein BZG36_03423 [Bifiguratus adelaidae]